jgi:serine/threonine protein kinase/tetratricopeptide (TPR) repeat protein
MPSTQGSRWFGPYRVVSSLATGGMGVLYRAEHRETGAAVAIKTVVNFKGGIVDGIRSEIRSLARLVHPGVARIVDEGIEDGHPWYAMELVDGRTLATFRDELWQGLTGADLTTHVEPASTAPISRSPTGPPHASAPAPSFGPALRAPAPRPLAAAGRLPAVLEVMRRLCAPLGYVHGRGIVHRDLKPENVLLKTDNAPVLIDFGVATRFPAAQGREILEPAGSLAGTVAYMAPEQFRRGVVDARADLYSLGCMLYEFVCGRRPFLGTASAHLGEAHLLEPPPSPSRLVQGVPAALENLILRLLAKRPRDRLGYAAEVAEALAAVLQDLRDLEELPGSPRRAFPTPTTSWPAAQTPTPAAPSPDAGTEAGFYLYRPEMTGRKEPTERLLAACEAARAGHGALFFLGGESGIGKTMLAGEIGKHAAAMGLRVVTGDCVMFGASAGPGHGTGSPLAPFRRLLHAVADHCRGRGPEATEQLFGSRGAVLASIEPTLESLPGLSVGSGETDLTGEAARSAILTAMADLVFALAREQPLLLVLDDVQWADELSLGVLKLLSPAALAPLPLLVVATYRTDELSPGLAELTAAPGAQDLRLGRLDEEGVASMVTEMLGMNQPPRSMIRFLARTSEGNPFFVAEYIRAAVGEGVLFRTGGHWQISPGIAGQGSEGAYETLPLPKSLRGLISRRLQGLHGPVGAVLETASVIGRQVDPALLAQVSAEEPGVIHDALSELLARQVLEDNGGQLLFVHEKLREHAYDGIEPDRRRALHLRVACALEEGESRGAHLLAFHFQAGGRPERAFHYATLAGRQARTAGALHDARDQLTQALRLEAEATGVERPLPTSLERARLRRMLGEARAGVGDLEGSEAILREAYGIVRRHALPRSRLGWAPLLFGQLALQLLRQLFTMRPRRQPEPARAALEESATIANRLGFSFMVQGSQLPMLAVLTLAANLAEVAQAPAPRGIPYSILASVFGLIGATRLSRRYFDSSRRSVANARDVVAPLQQAQIEGFYYLNRGEWTAARGAFEPAFARGQKLGIPYEIEALGIARAWLEILVGRLEAARALLIDVRRTAEVLGNRLHEWWARRYEALALLQEGRAREALDVVAPAEAGFRAQGGLVDLMNILAVQAVAYEHLGESDTALALANEALEIGARHQAAGSHSYELHAFLPEVFIRAWGRARAEASDEKPSSASGPSPAALARQVRLCLRGATRYARMFRIGQPTLLLNRARAAAVLGHTREADRLARRAAMVAAELGMPLDIDLESGALP